MGGIGIPIKSTIDSDFRTEWCAMTNNTFKTISERSYLHKIRI